MLSEQNIHFAELVSDRVYVLEKGEIDGQARWTIWSATPVSNAASLRFEGGPRYV